MVAAVGAYGNGRTAGFGLLGASFDDPENARIILLSAGALVVLGLLIAAGTVWWWRSSEIEHPALGPLEVMSSRSWWKGDYTSRRRRLEAARPEGAEPVDPPAVASSDPVDLEAAALASPPEFHDLIESATGDVSTPVAERTADVDPEPAVDGAVEGTEEPVEVEPAEAAAVEVPAEVVVPDVPRPIDPILRQQHDDE
jgi:hypothetical protein